MIDPRAKRRAQNQNNLAARASNTQVQTVDPKTKLRFYSPIMLTFAVNNFNACSKIFFTCLQTNWCISESDVSTLTRTSTEKFNLTGFSALKSKDLLLSVFKSSNLPVLSSLNVNSPMSDFG